MPTKALSPRLLERVIAQRGGLKQVVRLADAYDPTAPVEARVLAARWLLADPGKMDAKLVALKILAQHREEPPYDDLYQEPLATLMEELVGGWLKQITLEEYTERVERYTTCFLGSNAARPAVEHMRRFYGDIDLPMGALDDMIVALGDPEGFEMIDVAAARQATQRAAFALIPHAIADQIADATARTDWWLTEAGLDQLVDLLGSRREPADKRLLIEIIRRCDFLKHKDPSPWKVMHDKPGHYLLARCYPGCLKLFEQWLAPGMKPPQPLAKQHVRELMKGVKHELAVIASLKSRSAAVS